MKHFTLTFSIIICLFSCSNEENSEELKCFNNYLGKSKSEALTELTNSFENFLDDNYPDSKNFQDKVLSLFDDYSKSDQRSPNWVFPKTAKLIDKIEQTGLRSEIYLKPNEAYKPKDSITELLPPKKENLPTLGTLDLQKLEEELIPVIRDSNFTPRDTFKPQVTHKPRGIFNSQGLYLYGLLKCNPSNTLIYEYVDVKASEGNISPLIVIDGFTLAESKYDDPLVKRILAIEFYYSLLHSSKE
jgi:hypothetical protein